MNLEQELKTFSNYLNLESEYFGITSVGPSIIHLKNKSKTTAKTMGFLALVHGNEYLGLPILNTLLKSMLNGETKFGCDVYFGLGNIPAALANKRFMDEDLNRCFGKTVDDTPEARCARELEVLMLDKCDFLIDIHQTISSASNPFFIFQYASQHCLSVMQKWNPGIPTVLQQEQIGENTGLSTDEYLRSRKKFGTALELGQLGTSEHFDLGLKICKNALETVNDYLGKDTSVVTFEFPLLELNNSYKVQNSSYKLDDGWKNLKPFTKGERLGTYDNGIIEAPESGYMLFPRYRTVEKGQDLFYYCKTWNNMISDSNSKPKAHSYTESVHS